MVGVHPQVAHAEAVVLVLAAQGGRRTHVGGVALVLQPAHAQRHVLSAVLVAQVQVAKAQIALGLVLHAGDVGLVVQARVAEPVLLVGDAGLVLQPGVTQAQVPIAEVALGLRLVLVGAGVLLGHTEIAHAEVVGLIGLAVAQREVAHAEVVLVGGLLLRVRQVTHSQVVGLVLPAQGGGVLHAGDVGLHILAARGGVGPHIGAIALLLQAPQPQVVVEVLASRGGLVLQVGDVALRLVAQLRRLQPNVLAAHRGLRAHVGAVAPEVLPAHGRLSSDVRGVLLLVDVAPAHVVVEVLATQGRLGPHVRVVARRLSAHIGVVARGLGPDIGAVARGRRTHVGGVALLLDPFVADVVIQVLPTHGRVGPHIRGVALLLDALLANVIVQRLPALSRQVLHARNVLRVLQAPLLPVGRAVQVGHGVSQPLVGHARSQALRDALARAAKAPRGHGPAAQRRQSVEVQRLVVAVGQGLRLGIQKRVHLIRQCHRVTSLQLDPCSAHAGIDPSTAAGVPVRSISLHHHALARPQRCDVERVQEHVGLGGFHRLAQVGQLLQQKTRQRGRVLRGDRRVVDHQYAPRFTTSRSIPFRRHANPAVLLMRSDKKRPVAKASALRVDPMV